MIIDYEIPEKKEKKAGRPNSFDFFKVCFVCPFSDCRFLHSWDCPLVRAEQGRPPKAPKKVKVKKKK